MTLADIAVWVGAVVLTLGISVIYQRLRPGEMMSREQHLEERVRQLTEQVASLQSTINMLSARILELERENRNLRRAVAQAIGMKSQRRDEIADLRQALERLSAEEIRRLAFESFRDVFDGFGAEQSVQAQRLALLEWAENHKETDELREAISAINPAAFG